MGRVLSAYSSTGENPLFPCTCWLGILNSSSSYAGVRLTFAYTYEVEIPDAAEDTLRCSPLYKSLLHQG